MTVLQQSLPPLSAVAAGAVALPAIVAATPDAALSLHHSVLPGVVCVVAVAVAVAVEVAGTSTVVVSTTS